MNGADWLRRETKRCTFCIRETKTSAYLVQSSKRIVYPTSAPNLQPNSSATRLATDIAATRLNATDLLLENKCAHCKQIAKSKSQILIMHRSAPTSVEYSQSFRVSPTRPPPCTASSGWSFPNRSLRQQPANRASTEDCSTQQVNHLTDARIDKE